MVQARGLGKICSQSFAWLKDLEKVENHPDFSVIGHMTKESDVNLITKGGKTTPISSMGWKSF